MIFSYLQSILLQVQSYYELDPDAFIKQPWNTYSSLVFFIPVTYWAIKLKDDYKEYIVLSAILPLLFLNGLGSTLFHAFNGGIFYMMLDVVPPFLMMLFLATYFWKVAIGSWLRGILMVVSFLTVNFILTYWSSSKDEMGHGLNVYYLITGLMVLTPIFINLHRSHWHGWHLIVLALVCVTLALICRSLDYPTPNPFPDFLPQGTHFMWHIISALAVFPLGMYLIRLRSYTRLSNIKRLSAEG